MPLGVNHIGIQVSDLDRSLDFYRRVFELTAGKRYKMPEMNLEIALLNTAGCDIELLKYDDKPAPTGESRLIHFALEVTNIEQVLETMARCGYPVPSGSPQVILGGKTRIFFIDGPDRESIELWQCLP